MSAFQYPETYRHILDGLQIGVSVLDLEKKIVFWSDGAEQITGYSRIDVVGHSCRENIFLHCNEISCEMCGVKCSIRAALHDGKPVQTIGLIHHKSGQRAPARTWATPLRDKHGSIIGIIQTFEAEFAVAGPDPDDRGRNDRSMNDHSMNDRGCLDQVTGLPNQTIMQSHLREKLATLAELQIPFGIVCAEIAELSQFRARYGQEAATALLQVMARTLRNTVWPTDFVGRWSEGQFLTILSGCGESALQAVSERMHKLMAGAAIHWWGEELSVAVSMGRASALASDTIDSLLQRAQHELGGNKGQAPLRDASAAGANWSPGK
jgi:diguanylate cyclase (GGDEF)-like protein/PAS domain S-box-containing protein